MTRQQWMFLGLAFLGVHWLNQLFGGYELMFDEAQYWFWGQRPAWGYYSKPPMIGWIIHVSSAVFGDEAFGVKMLSPLLLLGAAWVLYDTALQLGMKRPVAAWVPITWLTLPVITGNAMFITTDVPLQCCWALALNAVIRAMKTGGARWWLLAGAGAGLGLLSKYTMVAFAASVLAALLLTGERRRMLARPWPWLAALVALAIFAPNLWWNAQHQFVTFAHTNENVFSKQIEIYPGDMLAFIGAQFGIFGPVLLLSLLLSLHGLRRDSDRAMLHCFVWPLALAGVVVSLLAGAQAHWIAPCYLAGVLIVVPWLAERAPRWLRYSLALHGLVLVLFIAAPFVPLPLKEDPFARLFVWNHLAEDIRPLAEHYPQAHVITDERKIATALTWKLRDLPNAYPVYKWNPAGLIHDHYDLLTAQTELSGAPLLLVSRKAEPVGLAGQQAKLLARPSRDGFDFSVYYIPHFKGFK